MNASGLPERVGLLLLLLPPVDRYNLRRHVVGSGCHPARITAGGLVGTRDALSVLLLLSRLWKYSQLARYFGQCLIAGFALMASRTAPFDRSSPFGSGLPLGPLTPENRSEAFL